MTAGNADMTQADCYCAALRKAARRMTTQYDQALAVFGITLAQFSLLRTIARRGPISLTDLGRRLELDRSTVGRNVRVVVKAGLAQTAPAEDHREALIAISPAGAAILERATPAWAETQARITERLGAADVETLLDRLGAI